MKKLIILCMIALLVVSFAACAKEEEAGLTVEKGVLKVGMDLQYPPFETFDDNSQPMGVSVDVAQAFADSLGLELEVVNMDFSTLIPALETGDIDIVIASMSITEERELKVDFTDPYFYFKIVGLMNKDYADTHMLGDDSTGEDLWAIESTRFIGLVGQISTSIPEQRGFDVQQSVDKSAAITEITTGRGDVMLISAEVVASAHEANPDTTEIFWSPLDISPIGMAVVEGNSELLAKANAFIDQLDEDGGVYDTLRDKYAQEMIELFGEGATLDIYIYED